MNGIKATQAAKLLSAAWRDHRQISDLPDDLKPETRAEAYAIQDELARLLGFDVSGWKVGMSSPASFRKAGFDEPIPGRLFAPTLTQSPAVFAANTFASPMVETEFAFRLLAPLPARIEPYSRNEVAAVAVLHLAIEIGDFRMTRLLNAFIGTSQADNNQAAPQMEPLPWIADNGGGGGFVVGPEISEWHELDLKNQSVELRINDELAASNLIDDDRCDPLGVLQWTANHLSQRNIGLDADAYITTGTATTPILVSAGIDATARFGDLGEVRVRFTP